MKNASIGIMQGRVSPRFLDRLQIFPLDTWCDELGIAESIGFQHIELLWDSKHEIKQAKGLMKSIDGLPQLHAPSMVIDSISKLSSLDDILAEIFDVFDTFKDETPSILVIPLLDNAKINTVDSLKKFIKKVESHKVLDLLKLYNVRLALELDMPSSGIIEAMEASVCDVIGMCLDSGNLWYYSECPLEDIQKLSKLIIHVHIKDRDEAGKNVLLGDGLVDFCGFAGVLKKIGYSNYLTLEKK
jgi:L-ribulose-5-phosphate 3-epimerase